MVCIRNSSLKKCAPLRREELIHNHLMTVDGYTIKNINDGRVMEFNSGQELRNYFGLNGHDTNHYIKTGHILMSEWEVISKSRKVLVNPNAG